MASSCEVLRSLREAARRKRGIATRSLGRARRPSKPHLRPSPPGQLPWPAAWAGSELLGGGKMMMMREITGRLHLRRGRRAVRQTSDGVL